MLLARCTDYFPILLLCAFSALFPSFTDACEQRPNAPQATLRVPARNFKSHNKYSHTIDLLQLALNKTQTEYGPCKVIEVEHARPTNRVLIQLSDGLQFDTVRASVNKDRDDKLLPISFPVFRGLMGYRVLVTNKNHKANFSTIETQEDLRKFTYGVGINWTDADILAKNGLTTVGAYDIASLYKMLELKRFDGILRGSHEIIGDQLRLTPTNTQVEDHLVIAYPMPVNFYVEKPNTRLAQRLKLGLDRAQQDGSMDTYFNNSPLVQDTLKNLALMERQFIYFCNHTLTREADINNDSYWLKPWPTHIKACQNKIVEQNKARSRLQKFSAIEQSP